MRETAEDLQRLQALLDDSYQRAGTHLRSIVRPERRLDAAALSERLPGMCLLALATSTRDGRPLLGAVDGIFFRGAFHFGSSRDSVRYRHLLTRPHVSATHLPSEALQVTVHGVASRLEMAGDAHRELRETMREIYTPNFGSGEAVDAFVTSGSVYWRIDAQRMITFWDPSLLPT